MNFITDMINIGQELFNPQHPERGNCIVVAKRDFSRGTLFTVQYSNKEYRNYYYSTIRNFTFVSSNTEFVQSPLHKDTFVQKTVENKFNTEVKENKCQIINLIIEK